MMEYPYDEAKQTLTETINGSKDRVGKLDADITHLNTELHKMEELIKNIVDAGIALEKKKPQKA